MYTVFNQQNDDLSSLEEAVDERIMSQQSQEEVCLKSTLLSVPDAIVPATGYASEKLLIAMSI